MNELAKMGLTVREAAKYTGVGEHLLRSLVRVGKLPALKVGQRSVIMRNALDEFMRINADVDLLDFISVKKVGEEDKE